MYIILLGDASAEDKANLENSKTDFERLKNLGNELSVCLGSQLKRFNEEPSDDEEDELAAAEVFCCFYVSMYADGQSTNRRPGCYVARR